LRFQQWKVHFMEQRARGLAVWREPLTPLRVPKLFNLRSDPFERADQDASMYYDRWFGERGFILVPAQALVAEYLKTFEQFPPRQRPASFSIDQAVERARERQKTLAATTAGLEDEAQPGEDRASVH